MKKLLLFISVLFFSFSILACTNNTTTDTIPTNSTEQIDKQIEVSKENIEIALGSEYILEYELNFEPLGSEAITFSSSNEEVATVDNLGKVKAIDYGESVITISYLNEAEAQIRVLVNQYYEIVLPNKLTLALEEDLNLTGAMINIYNINHSFVESIPIEPEFIIDDKKGESGSVLVELTYNDVNLSFEIYRLSEKQSNIRFDDFIYLNQEIIVGERLDFALMKADVDLLKMSLDNVYDYEEINIYALIDTPSEKLDKIFAFWYQDFQERLTNVTINPNLRLEGKVNDLADDYDYFVGFREEGNPHYRLRYLPEESGVHQVTVVVEVDGIQIQTFTKDFTVSEEVKDNYRGFVRIDSSNNQNFIFDNGETYLPVGQNVAWYSSVERKHYDYKAWFEKMGEVGMNYSRVWMAAWGFSPFWDDIYNFDERQTNLYSLDKTIEMAEVEDIYIQLCILHHGMFSSDVNPMWPDAQNTWYVNKYGSNPYAEVIADSGLFFTNQEIKENFKNQLKYIVARYGFSDKIMSFELFNEVDWIETYNVSDGLFWHQEMADYLKSIDTNKHLLTTSLNNQSIYANNYKVFNLNSIDFVNVHHYGIYNHVDYLPSRQYTTRNLFNKPVLYSEIGYSGMGGEDQYQVDPNNVTLHQGLWAGALGGGAGSGMHWWWESWTETYDVYSSYQGLATFAKELDLTGDDQVKVNSEVDNYDLLNINSISTGYMGYQYQDRIYLYVYDKSYNLHNQTVAAKSALQLTAYNLLSGTYSLTCYDTITGEIIASSEIIVSQDNVNLSLPSFTRDIAVILEINN